MPYDDLGNFIPGDEADLDTMRYELSLADTVRQMIKSPANDLSMLTKPQTYKDIATGFGSAGESMVRGAGAVAFGFPGDIIKHFQDTTLIPGVTDKISMGNVFPGYETLQQAVAPTPFALPQRVPPNMSVAPERPKQEVFGLPYVTTGDILEAAPSRYTPQFGDEEANDFMESLGMFLSPSMAAGARKGIINMVETTGRMPSLTVDSAQAFARDYFNASRGIYPETPTAGSMAADFARTGKNVARGIEDVTFGNYQRGQVRRAAEGVPEDTAYDPLRQRREDQAVATYSVPEGANPIYAVRRANQGQMLKEVDHPDNKYIEVNPTIQTAGYMLEQDLPYVDEAFPNITRSEYYKKIIDKEPDLSVTYREWQNKKFMELYPDAPDVNAAQDRYNNSASLKNLSLERMKFFTEFKDSPEFQDWARDKMYARNSAIEDYNEVKNKPKKEITEGLTTESEIREAKEAHQGKVEELELELLKKDYAPELSEADYIKRITPPSAEEYMRRANAARKYILGEFRNDLAKYIGTSQGPQMELAKRGITIVPREDLLEKAKQINQGGQDFRDLQKKREDARFEAKGEMYPLIVNKETELVKLQENLNEMNAKRTELTQQHRIEMPGEPDPANNTGPTGAAYRALKNPMNTLIDKMEKSKKQLQNFQLANAYELFSDLAYLPQTAEYFRKVIPYKQKDFFPLFDKNKETGEFFTPDQAEMFNLSTGRMKQLGIDFLAEQYTNAILDGRVPIDEKGKPTVSVEKFIEQITKPRLKEEELKNLEGSKAMMRVNDYARRTLDNIPPELKFQNASVLELTKDNPMPVIRRQVSFDGMVLDNCVAGCAAPHPGVNPFTNEPYSHSYPVDVATNTNRGDRAYSSSFMEEIQKGFQRYASLRNNQTGLPVVNINMYRTGDQNLPDSQRKFNLHFVSGYQNDKIDKKYTNDVRDYLNARADIILGSGKGIDKWGIFDLNNPEGQSAAGRALGVPETAISSFDLPRFVTEKDLRDLAKQQPVGDTHADLVAARTRMTDDLRIARNQFGPNSPEVESIADNIRDIEARLSAISNEVRTAPNRDLALQRDDNGMNRLIAEEQPNIERAWEDVLQNMYDYENMTPAEIRQQAAMMRRNPATVLREYDEQFLLNPGFLEGVARQLEEQANQLETLLREMVEPVAAPRYTPRDIALGVAGVPQENIERLANQIQNVVTNIGIAGQVGNRTTLEQLRESFSNPNNLPEPIIDYTHDYEDLERISNYLIEHIDYNLANRPQAAQLPAPVGDFPRATEVVSELTQSLYTEARDNNFNDRRDLTSTLYALDAGNYDHPLINDLPEAYRPAVQRDIAASMRLLLQNQNINIPINIFDDGVLDVPADGNGPEAYHIYTNELTGSRRAYDEVMQAERMTPGAINDAILRTDGDARYNEDIRTFYRVDSPAGISQLNNALRRYMEGNGFDVPPAPRAIDQLETRYPARENEYVYDPDDMMTEIDYEMERQERILTREQYGRLEDLVDEIQRDAGENFEDLIDTIDRIRMRQGVDGDVNLALGDLRTRLVRTEEASRLEFDRQQRNRDVVVEPEAALLGSIEAQGELNGPEMMQEIRDLVDNIQNDDLLFDREPAQFIRRLRDEAAEYADHNAGYAAAVNQMADFLENYMRERAARPRGRKRGGFIKKMNNGGKVEFQNPEDRDGMFSYPPGYYHEAANSINSEGQSGGYNDAARHIIAAADISRRIKNIPLIGEHIAEPTANFMGRLHEYANYVENIGGKKPQTVEDMQQDLHNNRLGAKLGMTASNFQDIINRTPELLKVRPYASDPNRAMVRHPDEVKTPYKPFKIFKKGGVVEQKQVYFAENPDAMRFELLRNK